MKNNFDLTNYMKSNKVGAYQQLNEMWYQDINQALGDFNTMKEVVISAYDRDYHYWVNNLNKDSCDLAIAKKSSNKVH